MITHVVQSVYHKAATSYDCHSLNKSEPQVSVKAVIRLIAIRRTTMVVGVIWSGSK